MVGEVASLKHELAVEILDVANAGVRQTTHIGDDAVEGAFREPETMLAGRELPEVARGLGDSLVI